MAFEVLIVVGTYIAILCGIDIEVGCVLAHICKNVGSICQFSIMACGSCLQCESHICSETYPICVQYMGGSRDLVCMYAYRYTYMHHMHTHTYIYRVMGVCLHIYIHILMQTLHTF